MFEVPAGAPLAPGQFLLSEREGAAGPVLRVACDEPPADGVPVPAGLEDAFLYVYRDAEEGSRGISARPAAGKGRRKGGRGHVDGGGARAGAAGGGMGARADAGGAEGGRP